MTRATWSLVAASALGLTALNGCGGGDGGSSGPGPGPVEYRPPTFTSTTTLTVPEGITGTVYMATATDPDGDALTFSLVGGADRARFAITAAGALTFVASPDFDTPVDADGDNVYLVQIEVSDGRTSATLDLAITISYQRPERFELYQVRAGYNQPVALVDARDGQGAVYVIERGGRIPIFYPGSPNGQFMNIAGQTTTDGERGVLGMALAPNFETSRFFYIFLTNTVGDIEVRRYRTLVTNAGIGDPASADVILSIPHSRYSNHNGGFIEFGPDGFLYLGIGDGGGAGDPDGNAQNQNSLLGKILRIDVSGDDFPADPQRDYRIPADNPFAGGGGAPEVWAYGLRNPFRGSFDPVTQYLFIGDVGQDEREEVNLMRPTDGGANFGWPVVEGTLGTPQPGFVPPVAEYGHGSSPIQGNSIIGGRVYRGSVEELRGHYIFGDFVSGNIWSIPVSQFVPGQTVPASQFTRRNRDFAPVSGSINNPIFFGVTGGSAFYITDFDGEVYLIRPK